MVQNSTPNVVYGSEYDIVSISILKSEKFKALF